MDAAVVQQAVAGMAARPTNRLAPLIVLFRQARILYDYAEDGRLLRMNQVMCRVGLDSLPADFLEILPPPAAWCNSRLRGPAERHPGVSGQRVAGGGWRVAGDALW